MTTDTRIAAIKERAEKAVSLGIMIDADSVDVIHLVANDVPYLLAELAERDRVIAEKDVVINDLRRDVKDRIDDVRTLRALIDEDLK